MRAILTLIFMVIFGSCVYSQTVERVPIENTNTYPPNTPEHDSLKAIQIFNDSINYEISLIDQHLNSIQIKWDFIMGNPEEKAIADDTGWFDDMTRIKNELVAKREELVLSLK